MQNDLDNQRIRKTIVALITGNLRRKNDASHVFIDPATESASGLSYPSLISCYNLLTFEQANIIQVIGQLSALLRQQLDTSLKAALELS